MKSHKTEGYVSTGVQQSIFRVGDYGGVGVALTIPDIIDSMKLRLDASIYEVFNLPVIYFGYTYLVSTIIVNIRPMGDK